MADINILNLEEGEANADKTTTIGTDFANLNVDFGDLKNYADSIETEIKNSVTDISEFIGKIASASKIYFAKDNDKPTFTIPTLTFGGFEGGTGGGFYSDDGKRSGGVGINYGSSGSVAKTDDQTEIEKEEIEEVNIPVVEIPDIEEDEENQTPEKLKQQLVEKLEQLSIDDTYKLIDVIYDLANINGKTIAELLDDPAQAELIKKILLSSPNVSEPLKKIIEQLDAETVRQVVKEVIQNKNPELLEFDYSALEFEGLEGLLGLIEEAMQYADEMKKTVDQVISDPVEYENLKKLLVDSPYVPQKFKDQIAKLDARSVRIIFSNVIKGDYPEVYSMNSLNTGVMYSYLRNYASKNNITVEELVGNSNNSGLLKEALTQVSSVTELIKGWEKLKPEEFQDQLKSFYLGDVGEEFPDSDIDATRVFVDYLADECQIGYEEFLNNGNYASTLKEGAIELGKSLVFLEVNSSVSSESAQNNLTKIFGGSNYKAYGMTENDLSTFKDELSIAAKKNSVKVDEFLSNTKYADAVKETLSNSDSASGVGSIYKNSDATVSQKVASNLYNTVISEKKSK